MSLLRQAANLMFGPPTPLDEALALINAYSPFGEKLIRYARDNGVNIGAAPLGDVKGTYRRWKTAALVNAKNTASENLGTIPHEIMHAIQDIVHHALYCSTPRDDGRTRITHSLAAEAAAETCAALICHQMRMNGYNEKIEGLEKYHLVHSTYSRTFNQSIAGKRTGQEAQQAACDAAYHAYFKIPPVTYYIMGELTDYITRIITGTITRNDLPANTCSADTAHAMTQVERGEFLVSAVHLPETDRALFLGHNRLRQAFDYVEMQRLLITGAADKNALSVMRMDAALLADNNPYRGLDLHDAYEHYQEDEEDDVPDLNMLAIMDDMAGLDVRRQIPFDFDPPRVKQPALRP